ncbi:MerR family transcriptional regulator [Sporolactobacillus shoreicorticis]|uniref:MerR family transcriptional regulator n=1 Tax=Sporolactobacillus shoreicorticis TaxID=1923877 RepID=A0ABW5S2W2_9BACL|nr:MerR family transcriptional regulator [Sporolactobacillus shoreicorticis]MCO7125248.1 MerR family transcriptional regulator [Sporolactobacillus shoreicorticis]
MSAYSITEVSIKYNLPASTLRYYEDIGLIKDVKREGNKRIYSDDNLSRLDAIRCFKNTGMTIAELQTLFRYENQEHNLDKVIDLLENHCDRVANQLELLQNNQRHIKRKLNYYQDIRTAKQQHKSPPKWEDYHLDMF